MRNGITLLYIFAGLPGAGKSTLSSAIAHHLGAVYLRIDTIEQALRDAGISVDGPAGYNVGYALARENLRLGIPVVAESVNPLRITREAWRDCARAAGVAFVEIEVVCSDRTEHRRRVEERQSTVPGLTLPTWDDVENREYEPWDTEPVVVDTAGQTPEQSVSVLLQSLDQRRIASAPS